MRLPAPPLEGGVEWVNTAGPVKLTDLRGRFVLLDFWTYCCINCMHVLPELKKLKQAFPNELVVIGVHSAKFEGEQDSQNIREAVHAVRDRASGGQRRGDGDLAALSGAELADAGADRSGGRRGVGRERRADV